MKDELMLSHFPWTIKRGRLCLSVMDSKGYPVAVASERPDQVANANLLAAAPAMLAALTKAVEWAALNKQRAGTLNVDEMVAAISRAVEYPQCRRCKNAMDGVTGLCPDGYGHVAP